VGVKNKAEVMVGTDDIPQIEFTYREPSGETARIEKEALLNILSNGEKKALYILNVLFEIETRKKAVQKTLIIVDDLADSFDYQNKYAIIHYLKDISENLPFKLIIMTHNFDFFRTIQSRFVGYNQSLMAMKEDSGITLTVAVGFKNPFGEWKKHFFDDPKMKIASICFIRNLVEYTKNEKDPDYLKLTSLLHQKSDTKTITIDDLDKIFTGVFGIAGASKNPKALACDVIEKEAQEIVKGKGAINLEGKIVLAIATRLAAEKFLIAKIADQNFVDAIQSVQTPRLAEEFKKKFPKEAEVFKVIDRVLVVTPENIHLNSFMYEPIIDMSGDQLRRLYGDVVSLK
jgi:energy-coupling factor transporter ATP-binding protein EcfA2